MQVEGVRELKILQEENARLKKLVAELSLDKAILQDVVSKSGTARAATGSGEVYRELRRPKVGAGLQTDEAGTQPSACTAERTQSCRCSSV
jgi:putative transposase